MSRTLFEMPNSPEEFGVALAPAELRALDFSALDFNTLNRVCVEYIRTYFPNDFNDFFASNGIIMMMELLSYIGNVLSERGDVLVDESFLPTAQTKQAGIQHLALINQKMVRATPATAEIAISVASPVPSEIRIPAGTRFSLGGPDGKPVYYEIYRSPGDFTSYIPIAPGKRGVVAYGIEGSTGTPISVTANGGANQFIDIPFANVLDDPITVEVTTGSETREWRRVEIIQKWGPNEEVFEVKDLGDSLRVVFGDNTNGKEPLAGQSITVNYRIGGGLRGRIAANTINETRSVSPQPPTSAAVEVAFRNLSPSAGGTDAETLDQAKRRAPREYATHNNAVTGEDYGLLATNYKQSVYGSVSKAVGILRTGVDQDISAIAASVRAASTLDEAVQIMQTQFINRNIVELYVLSEGPNNTPVTPNDGLKQGLVSYFEGINVLTDEVRVYDGAIKPVDVSAIITVSRSADPGTVKVGVQNAVAEFFDIRNFDMGTALFLSNLYQTIQAVPGVKSVNIFDPQDDILPTNKLGDPSEQGVGFNEIVTLGESNLRFYYEQGSYKASRPS